MDLHRTLESFDVNLTGRERVALLRRHALHLKYSQAVEFYADTDKPLRVIADECGVTVGGLSNYLRRYWRELVLQRHKILADGINPDEIKIIQAGKQNVIAHAKYKKAVAACGTLKNIDLNISQVARKYGVDCTALLNFMHVHYPDILSWREKMRLQLGLDKNVHHGLRLVCQKQYAEAVDLYRNTDMTVHEISEKCKVSEGGLSQHLRFYYKDLLVRKRNQRKVVSASENKVLGDMLGNGRKYCPSQATEEKYAVALKMYRETSLTMKEIVKRTGVPAEGFRFYLHKWHKELVAERNSVSGSRRLKATRAKYEHAIESLRDNPRPVSAVATEFGFNPEVFRAYLHKHEPDLVKQQGMVRVSNGKTISRRSDELYSEAVNLYATTNESLRAIATRLGLVYKTVDGFIRRNYPEVIARHKALVKNK